MNKYNFAIYMSILAAISVSVGIVGSVAAQDNMTMSMDNTTAKMNNNTTDNQTFTPMSEISSDNTSQITDAQRGIDANKIKGQ